MHMTEPNEPDKKNEAAEPTEDEPIIGLKDETVEAVTDAATADKAPIAPEQELKGDEEIIDLLQAVEEPFAIDLDETVSEEATEPTESQAPKELENETAIETEKDENIIDFMDTVEAKEPMEDEVPIALEKEVADETKDDEEIIDLVDAAEEISVTNDTESIVDEILEPAEDETIIDLTETVGDTSLEIEDIGEPIPEAANSVQEFDDISEFDSDLIEEPIDFTEKLDSDTVAGNALKDDFADSLGIEFDSDEDAKENFFDPDRVSSEQVEAALERVIKKMFYEKIDRLLVDTIEKTVTREIERLKKALLDDATDSEK
jgi:hypothetical protein